MSIRGYRESYCRETEHEREDMAAPKTWEEAKVRRTTGIHADPNEGIRDGVKSVKKMNEGQEFWG